MLNLKILNMKKIKIALLITVLLGISISQTGCYGSFKLTNKVYDFNTSVGDKFVNELVFLAFLIVPVYEISFLIDGVVLNSIEFWTGSNPMAMKENESESKYITAKGKRIKITATNLACQKKSQKSLKGLNKSEKDLFLNKNITKTKGVNKTSLNKPKTNLASESISSIKQKNI